MALFGRKKPTDADQKRQSSSSPEANQPDATAPGTLSKTPTGRGPNMSETKRKQINDGPPLSNGEKTVGPIGKSIVIKGELTGSEDVEIDGTVEGDIRFPNNVLTIGPNGKVSGTIQAQTVQILGTVKGNVEASERVQIDASGTVEGDLRAPRLLVEEGAVVNGSIEMTDQGSTGSSSSSRQSEGSTPSVKAIK